MYQSHSYAQTITSLYLQLSRDGYSSHDLEVIRRTYDFSRQLFTCLYRPSGKTFMSHLVGVSSILGELRVSIELVASGLIHSAYSDGEFGERGRGLSNRKREEVLGVVGRDIEEYAARYCTTLWQDESVPAVLARLSTCDEKERAVLLMRLANELEDNLDGGVLYAPNAKAIQTGIALFGHLKLDLAERLGYPTLASALKRVYQNNGTAPIPAKLQRSGGGTRSFVILPFTYANHLPVSFLSALKLRKGFSLQAPASTQADAAVREHPDNQETEMHYAETNIQLYKQMLEHNYSSEDIVRVRDAYELAMHLFAGQFQTHGKTVIAHVVGAASILTSLQAPATVVMAGLLHNAFWGGDFGDGRTGITQARCRYIRGRVGKEVEQYLVGFATLRVGRETASSLRAQVPEMCEGDRRVALLYLADNLEHNLYSGVLYYGEAQRELYLHGGNNEWADLAMALGFPTLANRLTEIHRGNSSATPPLPPPALSGRDRETVIPRRSRRRTLFAIGAAARSTFGRLSHRLQQPTG